MITNSELKSRWTRLQEVIKRENCAGLLVSSNVNLYYTSGAVISGFVYIPSEGDAQIFVRRPVGVENATYIRKFEDIAAHLTAEQLSAPTLLELESSSFLEVSRFQKLFSGEVKNGSATLREVRAIKSDYELDLMRKSGAAHQKAYENIPAIFKKGMSDIDFSIELEREMRKQGSLGIFRIAGSSMEIFAGSLLVGDNADAPAPYDFALGGAGMDSSIPVGCNGTKIDGDMAIMVDLGGNFTGYISDMSRVYSVGNIGEVATKAHQTSLDICRAVEAMAKEGVAAADLYNLASEMARERGLEQYFMGHTQKAPFVGHGIGIEINEQPVLAPRSRDILKSGMVFALEPKFVIPHIGAVGVENSYIVLKDGVEKITNAAEQIISL